MRWPNDARVRPLGAIYERPRNERVQWSRDVYVDFVEETSIQALLDDVGAVDPNGLPGGRGFGLVYGGVDAIGHDPTDAARSEQPG